MDCPKSGGMNLENYKKHHRQFSLVMWFTLPDNRVVWQVVYSLRGAVPWSGTFSIIHFSAVLVSRYCRTGEVQGPLVAYNAAHAISSHTSPGVFL